MDNNVSYETSNYTKYILGLDPAVFSEIADEKGIDVSKPVTFKTELNGKDGEGNANGEYTVIGM